MFLSSPFTTLTLDCSIPAHPIPTHVGPPLVTSTSSNIPIPPSILPTAHAYLLRTPYYAPDGALFPGCRCTIIVIHRELDRTGLAVCNGPQPPPNNHPDLSIAHAKLPLAERLHAHSIATTMARSGDTDVVSLKLPLKPSSTHYGVGTE